MDASPKGALPRQWYVIRAKPHRERVVLAQLNRQGLEVFFPAVKVHPINPRAARERAYFPGYLFANLHLETVGAAALAALGGGPAGVWRRAGRGAGGADRAA
jgi:hypothetical protein